ncbi:glycosyltransferase family 2 protein [Carboxydothermus pertinax]|uniref:Protein containing Glycosyl transferase, family2 domain n=1 Tax=Carboxydothermus pertinax TaxID=870242 RepID=A0A1L8CYI0_9THEO|nr:glycosyltransferase family 2 protein [Carboxydothermus pertinax]GAV23970.1 protein containing Glycosyl transferase, family2 domain [Carboxydothermus pertinax]
MKKILIYIPSYNRSNSLIKQLSRLKNLVYNDNVIVYISDNCSTDKDYDSVRNYCGKYNNIIYDRNPANIGGNANIAKGFLLCDKAEYIWILSDDDILKDNVFNEILNFLNYDIDILVFSHNKNIQKFNIVEYTINDIFYLFNDISCISNVIYKSELIKEYIRYAFEYMFTCFPHLAVLIKTLNERKIKAGILKREKYFEPDFLPPVEGNVGYSKSYFGFVFLAELFNDKKIKRKFIDSWISFLYLRHWFLKSRNAQTYSLLAYYYIKKNKSFFKMFDLKLIAWKILTPYYTKLKKIGKKILGNRKI